jgi:VWFA-related protein
MRHPAQAILATTLFLAAAAVAHAVEPGQPTPKPLIECSNEELSQRVPSLKAVRFDRGDSLRDATLKSAGAALDSSLESFVDVSAKEEIFESRLERGGADLDAKHEEFRHVIHWPTGRPANGSEQRLGEFRIAGNDKQIGHAGGVGFFVISRFMNLLEFLLPGNRALSRFRAVGRVGTGDAESVVLVYAYVPGAKLDSGLAAKDGAPLEPMQGVVWVDAKTGWPRRVLVEPLRSLSENGIDELRTEIETEPIRFASVDATSLLPVRVTTHARRATTDIYTVHRLTGYRMYGVDSAGDAEMEKQYIGVTTASPLDPGPYEFLARGAILFLENKNAEAIAPLREALRLDASLAGVRVHLGLALDAAGDSTGAESELREASKLLGGTPPVHSALGIVLYRRGATKQAASEFQEVIRLSPKDSGAHANLAMALEKLGDLKGAVEELRAAVRLDPANAAVKSKLEQLTGALEAATRQAPPTPTIHVDVRQVIVPVLVRDRDGRHVSGLKQSDFRILEDGVEQTITAFQVESSGSPAVEAEPAPSAAAEPKPAGQANLALPKIRHTYLICLDTFRAAFGSLHYAREALQKFFQSQHTGDSQYALVALGPSMKMVQNLTQDPAKVLASLDDKNFSKMALGSQKTSWQAEIASFLDEMNEIRAQVDSRDPYERERGRVRMRSLPGTAQGLAEQDRFLTVTLLGQLKTLVAQMTKSKEHRTVLLISDGFQMNAGREPWELLLAFFPELSRHVMNAHDRLSSEFDAIVRVAAANNIVIDTIDSRGLYTQSFFDVSQRGVSATNAPRMMTAMGRLDSEAGDSLMEFAAATGGTAYRNSNDILAGIQRAVAEGRDYYSLGYVSTNAALDGKFRTIAVEVKGKKLVVQLKRGYWATDN